MATPGKMSMAEFSSLAGKLPGYVIVDLDEIDEFLRAAADARGDIDAMPKKWRELMYANRDMDPADFDERPRSEFGFSDFDPMFTQTFREMGSL